MSKFILSFGANAMDHIPDEDMPEVADAAHAVVGEILNAGVYVVAGGIETESSIVAIDGAVTKGPPRDEISGLTIVDVASREEALQWAAKIAVACRCAQTVWKIGDDPELEAMIQKVGKSS
jgi:hypothetical protein